MKLESLQDLYVDHLKDIYSAENQIVKALPKMAKAANSPQLQKAYQDHLEQTKHQVDRLQTIFDELGVKPTGPPLTQVKGGKSEHQRARCRLTPASG